MNQITIDREGAARLLAFLQCDGLWNPKRLHELGAGIESAAAGDFAPLAELLGTRDVARVPCLSCDGSGVIPSAIGKPPYTCVPCSGAGAIVQPSSAPVAAHSFREEDVVRVLPAQIKVTATVVADRTGTKTEPGWVRIANDTSGSWYERVENEFTLHTPWWITGQRLEEDGGAQVICAAVRAESEHAAKRIIAAAHDKPIEIEWRFCQEQVADWNPFNERFPRVAWMQWPEVKP